MKQRIGYIFLFCFLKMVAWAQQAPLPAITVKTVNNSVIVSWVNDYTKPVTTINIQRSYDSLKNFSTIGSVLSAQSRENGYTDVNPPFKKMYYRIFIAFEGGSYVITNPSKPVKDEVVLADADENLEQYPWYVNVNGVAKIYSPADKAATIKNNNINKPSITLPNKADVNIPPVKPTITYPSNTIFTAKDNNVVIHLPNYATSKYTAKFFDENETFLFELKKLNEEYLIVEKVNFVRTGWFRFELYENGTLIEDNKFQILKDAKKL